MRREHNIVGSTPTPPVEDGLIFHAPLTSNSVDIIGGKTSIGEAISYSTNGAYFNASTTVDSLKFLCYSVSQSELKSVKTIYCEFISMKSISSTQVVYFLGGSKTSDQYSYSSNNEGVWRHYRSIWSNKDCFCYKYSSTTNSSNPGFWKYDADASSSTSVTQNTIHKVVSCTYGNRQFTYYDGVKNYQVTNTDTFDQYPLTNNGQIGWYLFIGGRQHMVQKQLIGYVRNLKMYTKEFTDAELAAMTTL